MSDRLGAYMRLMRVDKPIGSLLLLWPTLWALWVAGQGYPEPHIVLIFVAGVFLMRAAGCVINDVVDRNIDLHVDRTHDRPVTTGEISVQSALILFTVLCLISFAMVVLFLNRTTVYLAIVGAVLAASYPFFKRFTNLPQLYLGIAFGWGIPMAFAAHLETVPATGWMILLANVLWAGAYDTFYAMVDRDDDVRIGVKSLAVLAKTNDRLVICGFQAAALLTLMVVGFMEYLNNYYFLGLGVATLIAAWHQYSCRRDDKEKFFRAFLGNSWFGAAVFGGLVLSYL